ncbi:hypothetical protein [Accumulibacter sp.]|uniref:hypothetical protein n=1 Tax=Accumulibacter sp. TaxID=2053492 RepID=UPI002623D210|nr:hypothetical protein [Accumulibacter sp.]
MEGSLKMPVAGISSARIDPAPEGLTVRFANEIGRPRETCAKGIALMPPRCCFGLCVNSSTIDWDVIPRPVAAPEANNPAEQVLLH